MTPAEALASPRVVDDIREASHADRRTVLACLSGKSPYSKVWRRVADASSARGVQLPEPRERAERKPRVACAACAAKDARIAELEARLKAAPVVPIRPSVTLIDDTAVAVGPT